MAVVSGRILTFSVVSQ